MNVVDEGWGIVTLASCDHHFIRVHINLLYQPSNNKLFVLSYLFFPNKCFFK